MRYKINKISLKDFQGSPYLLVQNPVDVQGNPVPKFTIWKKQKDGSEFPGFDSLAEGSEVEGNAWNKPGTDNYTLYPPKIASNTSYTPRQSTQKPVPVVVQEMVSKGVEKSQDRKEELEEKKQEAINRSAAQRDAVLMVTTFYPEISSMSATSKEEILKEKISQWMRYFLGKSEEPFI